jgi:hypothetical protein
MLSSPSPLGEDMKPWPAGLGEIGEGLWMTDNAQPLTQL